MNFNMKSSPIVDEELYECAENRFAKIGEKYTKQYKIISKSSQTAVDG